MTLVHGLGGRLFANSGRLVYVMRDWADRG